ncbi:MAG: hypothetical protein MSG64_04250 [Pyrinomonadaceae bacterium MAG19_C2-C3]|nr:hypothetical protein [Pyrinomonadaceae bacterium MAG19_C2-C3]
MSAAFLHTLLQFILCVSLCVVLVSPVGLAIDEAGENFDTTYDTPRDATTDVQHQWGAITVFHGLPSNSVRAVAQDRDGIIWIGMDAGLARFDGHRVETVMLDDVARGSAVSALHVDGRGALWIGTNAGAVRRTGARWEFINETRDARITAIASSPDARVVMLATRGALFECRTNERNDADDERNDISETVFTVTKIEDSLLLQKASDAATSDASPVEITSLAYYRDKLFIGTRGRGLLILEDGTMRERLVRPRPFFVEAITANIAANNINPDDEALWFGAQTAFAASGLYVASPDTSETNHITDIDTGNVNALGFDKDGALWIGTQARGVMRRRPQGSFERWTFENTGGGLVSNQINCVLVDREGVAWFGTNRGVCRYDGGAVHIESIAAGAGANFIRTLYRTSDGGLWCGTQSGLFRFDETNARWLAVDDLSGRIVHAIGEDNAGHLFIGTASGLYVGRAKANTDDANVEGRTFDIKADDTNDAMKRDAASVRAVARWRGQTYLAVFGRGVERLDMTLDANRRTPLLSNVPVDKLPAALREPVSLYAEGNGSDGRLWIGTTRGAFAFDGERVTALEALAPLSDAGVWDIAGNVTRGLWFATSKGLYLWRAGELSLQVEGSVRSVRVVDENGAAQMWCAVDGGGVVTLRMNDDYGILKSSLAVEQGLPSPNAFAVLPLPVHNNDKGNNDGFSRTILTGTSQGLVRYKTSSVAPLAAWTRTNSRPLFVTSNSRASTLPAWRFAYPQNDVSVEVAGISSRTFPQKYQYGFTLQDENGRNVKRQFTSSPNFTAIDLAPGNYRIAAHTFTVDLTEADALAFNFTIEPPPFPATTLALSTLLALALGTLVWGAIQNRRLRLAGGELSRVNRELTGARLALANEAESERRRIARDLHDQTLADLRRLSLHFDETKAHTPEAFTVRDRIEAVSVEVRRICEDLSPSVLENVGLAAALEWSLVEACAQLPADARFAYKFACDESLDERLGLPVSVQIQLYRIVQEALSNITRHARASVVSLTVKFETDGALYIAVENDGASFNPAHVKRGRGITNMHARASLIAARLEWTSNDENSSGTRLTLRVPDATVKSR